MYEPLDIYVAFRRAQSNILNRGFRLPKDFDKHLNSKMSKSNRDALILATGYFNTKWQNVDPALFFDCGFELFKKFTYIQFFDERVMNLYKAKDKNRKREMEVNKEKLKESSAFVQKFMTDNEMKSLKEYCRRRNGESLIVVEHYLKGHIDKYFFVYLIDKRLILLNEDDKTMIPYIIEQYRECLQKLKELRK
jgi:hypothetical protein